MAPPDHGNLDGYSDDACSLPATSEDVKKTCEQIYESAVDIKLRPYANRPFTPKSDVIAFDDGNGEFYNYSNLDLKSPLSAILPNRETLSGPESVWGEELPKYFSTARNPYKAVNDFASNVSNFKIIESTLREGEEFANTFFSTEKKIEIASALDDLGMDYIELNSPAASKEFQADSEAISKLGLKSKLLTHFRSHLDDATSLGKPGIDRVFSPEWAHIIEQWTTCLKLERQAEAHLPKTRKTCLKCRLKRIRCDHTPENSGVSKLRAATSSFIVKQRGLKVLINNNKESAFGDTGAGQNVISDRRREELGLEMRPQPTSFPMGNSKRIFSPGTVEVPIAFEDDPTNVMTIVAHVVHTFAYDLLLGNPFLKATKCLTKFIHRFVPCSFSLMSKWSFNLLGETTHRFEGRLGKGIDVLALPDIGSMRNVMNAEWALDIAEAANFKILTGPENRGWILFPDGTEEATIGQALTTYTLPDGEIVPVVFELLPDCLEAVVLGQDFVFDNRIYEKYPGSILDFDSLDGGDELMPMGYRRNRSEGRKKGTGATLPQSKQIDDLDRQLEWNLMYQHGRAASVQEWDEENCRREAYERGRNSNWRPCISLIQYKPKGTGSMPAVRDSDTSSSAPSGDTTLKDSSRSSSSRDLTLLYSASSSSGSTQDQDNPTNKWGTFHLSDFESDEAAQWQEERPI